jgi:hypothetical protein
MLYAIKGPYGASSYESYYVLCCLETVLQNMAHKNDNYLVCILPLH